MAGQFRNVSDATYALVAELLESGRDVTVRGATTKEFLGRRSTLEQPLERYVFLPGRGADPVAQFAETIWVLAGRNDVPWLSRYLPRAPEFSDDGGATWHGAYGPRLRAWAGCDQIDQVRRLLRADPASRRAVMSLFDPARDFGQGRDIPCNNWMSWTIRDGRLHLAIALRSNDIVWGFSGINAFEWSVLHEMLAFWLGCKVGTATYFAASLHLYDRHFEKARRITSQPRPSTPYEGSIGVARFQTRWDDLPAALDRWAELEARISHDPNPPLGHFGAVGDPFLDSGLCLLRLHWGNQTWTAERLQRELEALPETDYALAARRHFSRIRADYAKIDPVEPLVAREPQVVRFRQAIQRLHERKDRAYGAAWRRRGERLSILPNIARKIDRLEEFRRTGLVLVGETTLDTAVDLYVYVAKYVNYLKYDGGNDAQFGDHQAFADLVAAQRFDSGGREPGRAIDEAVSAFEDLWPKVEAGASSHQRADLAAALLKASAAVLQALVEASPASAEAFIAKELADATA